MKKIVIFAIFCLAGLSADPVRNLKAFDQASGTEISGEWQNLSKKVLFTWKEPLAEIKAYKYVLGPTGKENLNQSTEANSCIVEIPQDGVYIFRVAPVDVSGKIGEERTFTVRLDTTPPQTTVRVTRNNTVLTFTPGKLTEGAELKGILFYCGPKQDGQPDRFCTSTADIAPLIPRQGDPDFYINIALEDLAGNVSAVQTVATLNAFAPALETGSPNMRILSRTSDILNEKKELVPGARIRYMLTLNNDGSTAAPLVELIDAVPVGTTLVPGSAKAQQAVRIEYFDTSLNGGKGAWTEKPTIESTTKIRWTYLKAFPAGGQPDTIEYVVEANKI